MVDFSFVLSKATFSATTLVTPTGITVDEIIVQSATAAARSYASSSSSAAIDGIYLGLVALVPMFFFLAHKRQQSIEDEAMADENVETLFKIAWMTSRWPPFVGMVEQWIYGKIPWGPWDASSIQSRWPDKRCLKRLIRTGIVPLYIQEGGLRTYQKRKGKMFGWDVTWPTYVRSKGRAYFDFVMLFPNGNLTQSIPMLDQTRKDFREALKQQKQHAVTISFWHGGKHSDLTEYSVLKPSTEFLEGGAEATFKLWLPFKSGKVITPGRGQQKKLDLRDFLREDRNLKTAMPLLSLWPFAVVRVEALDYNPVRLDEFVFRLARNADLKEIWTEKHLSRELGHVLGVELGLQFPMDMPFPEPPA